MAEPGPQVPDMLWLGLSSKVVTGGIVGSAIGTVIGGGSLKERVARGIVGAASAYIGHHFAAKIMIGVFAGALGWMIPAAYLPSVDEAEPVAALFIGLLGMTGCQIAINAMTAAREHVPEYVADKLDGDNEKGA